MFYWIGIAVCLLQSAMFSGLTIGLFGLSRLRLEVESASFNPQAIKILKLRSDSNFLLATLLWGNVGVNVLLTLLTDSILTGIGAFLFSTIAITVCGEIMPQAYLSRNALRIGTLLIPMVKLYQFCLFPIAKPTAILLDLWLGKESVDYLEESELKVLIKKHVKSIESDVDSFEGTGAINFLTLDDIKVFDEGEYIDTNSIIELPCKNGLPDFPGFKMSRKDAFLRKIQASGKKWVIIVDRETLEPVVVLDADGFLRHVMFERDSTHPYNYCHRPIVVKDPGTVLGKIIPRLKVVAAHASDDVIDHDIILFWSDQKKIITGSDILGRLLRGITKVVS